jgi:hypothetical protein
MGCPDCNGLGYIRKVTFDGRRSLSTCLRCKRKAMKSKLTNLVEHSQHDYGLERSKRGAQQMNRTTKAKGLLKRLREQGLG